MESRNTTLTTCGECASISPQDRKAVNTLEELLGQVEEKTSICFPLLDLIPEIIADENMVRSFKRVMSNLHNADTRNGLRWRENIVITRVRDNILKSKEQKTIQPTKGGHKMVTYQNYVSLFYCQITSCPSDGGIS